MSPSAGPNAVEGLANALIRRIPDTFDRALVRRGNPRIDVGRARAQHNLYCRHLETAGYDVEEVPTDEGHPDCVFIEDAAVVVGSTAVITRTGAPSRRGEAGPVAAALDRHLPLTRIEAPGTLEGGDVLTIGGRIYVGLSERTNPEGIEQLRSIATDQGLDVTAVRVLDGLHLKSVVLPVSGETVVVTPNAVEEAALDGLTVIYEHETERHRFSALPLRDGRLLVTAGAPKTASSLEVLGHDVVPIDVSQIQLADGGLTCMSILF